MNNFKIHQQFLMQLLSVLLLIILSSTSVIAQAKLNPTSTLQSEAEQAHKYYQNGEINKAIVHYKNYLDSVDFNTQEDLAWAAVNEFYILCYAPGLPGFTSWVDYECNDSAFAFNRLQMWVDRTECLVPGPLGYLGIMGTHITEQCTVLGNFYPTNTRHPRLINLPTVP